MTRRPLAENWCFIFFSALAEFERDLIRDRTNAGLAAARARGRKGGRPPLLIKPRSETHVENIIKKAKNTVDEICKIFGISRPAFYKYRNKTRKAIE